MDPAGIEPTSPKGTGLQPAGAHAPSNPETKKATLVSRGGLREVGLLVLLRKLALGMNVGLRVLRILGTPRQAYLDGSAAKAETGEAHGR